VTQATYAFGYGFSASPLQLARAYSILANDGLRREVRMTAIDQYQDESVRVINADIVKTVRQMLETAASDQGTGRRALIDGYSVGGKTGTARKIKATGGYDENRHMSLFAGLSPINNPRLVTVVVIDEPSEDKYYGGLVAAPVFSEVTGSALRLLQVTPDAMSAERNIVSLPAMLAKRGGL
jgi:cell division protein FtsI (penicillin-binding protein 3)